MECKKLKKEKENECDCPICIRKDAIICMFCVVIGFIITVMGMMSYITNYKPTVGLMTPLEILSFPWVIGGLFAMLGASAFAFGLFYTIIHADKFKEVEF